MLVVVERNEVLWGAGNPVSIASAQHLAEILYLSQKNNEALVIFSQCIQRLQKTDSVQTEQIAYAHHRTSKIYRRTKQWEKAETSLRYALT